MAKYYLIIVTTFMASVLATVVIVAAEESKTPQLKPEVQLELVQLQAQTLRIALTERNLETQYQAAQKQMDQAQALLLSKRATALERSGLDTKKYVVDQETFTVTEAPPAAAVVKK